MSRYGWERGELTLPAAEVAKVKRVLREAHNAECERVMTACKQFWTTEAKRARSAKLYAQRLDAWVPRHLDADTFDLVHGILDDLSSKPRQATWADLARHGVAKATNRTERFTYTFDETVVQINGRALLWNVADNNHAVERAHEHPVSRALFAYLARLRWTRDTGGVIYGNDEYNADAGRDGYGYGASYISRAFGPRGTRALASESGVSVAAYKRRGAVARARVLR